MIRGKQKLRYRRRRSQMKLISKFCDKENRRDSNVICCQLVFCLISKFLITFLHLRNCRVHAVIVASPTFTHEEIVIRSLNCKKAVFCEKPVAETRENTEHCYEVAKNVGKPLFTAFNRRFDPSYNAVRDRVRNGEVGHVHTMKTVSRDSPMPSIEYLKISGGIFHDCMVHDIDTMTWILGEYPLTVR